MNLYSSIAQRKSCRKYIMQPLEQAFIDEMETAIGQFMQLYPDTPLSHRFSSKVKGLYHVPAPHYLIISGQGKAGEQENAGFVFEQLALWLDANETGCVWLGASKDAETEKNENDIIVLAFGKTATPVHRTMQGFKRKPIEDITNAPDDECIKAVHLAPSGMNTQCWYFEKQGEKVLVYKQKLKPPVSLMYKLTDVDMGIALSHYALACQNEGKPFRFTKDVNFAEKAGYVPFGIIS